ncbi:MMPL family transporter [Streptomyces sp. NPDC006602]|uniref:MMPL family transporter n=1 Tax=Streptomyces sp. NPDC006602 TaxID=3364751 RepID=UPI0036842BB3
MRLPLKAIAMYLLSPTATFGVLVRIFQDGRLHNLLGFDPTGNIEPDMPIMLFGLTFGLSVDYEVFLVSRMREQYDQLGDSTQAAATGRLRSIGRLVASAALLMYVPLAAIGMSDVLTIKLFGVGMVFVVLVDVLVVCTLLGAAVTRLLGRAASWAPAPLARFYDRFGIKETDVPSDDTADKPVPVTVG